MDATARRMICAGHGTIPPRMLVVTIVEDLICRCGSSWMMMAVIVVGRQRRRRHDTAIVGQDLTPGIAARSAPTVARIEMLVAVVAADSRID